MAAEDISTLVLQVKSDGIKEGTDQLTALSQAADKAEGAAKKLGTQVAQTEAASRKASGSAKAMAEAEDTATKAVGAAVTAYQKKAVEQRRQVEMHNQLGRAYTQAQSEALRMNSAIDKSSTAMAKAHETALRMNAALDKRMAQKAAADFEKMWNEAQRMNVAYDASVQAMGRLQTKALEMNKAYDEQAAAGGRAAHGHGSNAAAIRETMVLMHELSQGQYKRFGGSMLVLTNQLDVIPNLLNFFKTASAGTILMMTGLTLGAVALAGAIGMVAVGLIQGAREQKHFNDALIQTGNYAGTTADGLHAMAKSAATMGGTIGEAKEAVLLLAQSGKFTATQIASIGQAATLTHEAFGVAIDKTVEEYEKLAELSITSTARSTNVISQHVLKLNDHYHFLTAKQYEQISALEKEGKAIEAAKLATDLFAQSQKSRAEESIGQLGTIARGWHGIKAAISGALDAIGQWGAKSTKTSELEELKKLRAAAADNNNVKGANRVAVLAMFDEKIKAKQKEIDDEALAAKKKSDAVQLEQDRMHASARIRVLVEANDKQAKKERELAELERDWSIQDAAYKLAHAKEYATARAKIIADAQPKELKTDDTRTVDRDASIDVLKKANREKLEEMDGFLTVSKEKARKEDADRWSELHQREFIYEAERQQLATALQKELAVYDSFKAKNPRERAVNARKRADAQGDYNIKLAGINRSESKDKEDVYAAEDQEMDKLEQKAKQHYAAEIKRINELVKAERVRLAGIAELKSVKMDAQAAEETATAKALEDQYRLNALGIEIGKNFQGWSDRKVAAAQKDQEALQAEIEGRKELTRLHTAEAGKQRGLEEADRMTKNLDAGVAAAKRFEKGLVSAFGNVGKAIGGMSTAFAQMAKDRDIAQQKFLHASEEEKASGEAQATLERERTSANLNGYAAMADAAKGFFDEKSKGYKIADGIAKGFHVAELARNAIQMVSNLATGASKMFAQSGWGGFAGVAAMAAVMAAFGISVAGSHNNGGKSAEEVQKTQGTGSVFGDIGTTNADGTVTYKDKSESILKSLDVLKDNSDMMLPVNQAMLASLQNIEASMVGLTNLVIRTPGLTNGTNLGIQTGTLGRNSIPVFGSIANAIASVPLLGGALSKVVSLWGKTTQEIKDSGLQFGGKVSDLQNGNGYSQYASVDTTKSSWFGLSKSTSNKVVTQGLNSELSQQFGLIFTNLEDTLKLAAGTLGKSGDEVGKAIENMVITTTQVSLKGLSGDDLQNAINGVISKTMDEIAQAAYPQMDAFRQVGEGYAQTVIRVASGVEQANAAMDKIGLTAVSYLNIANKTGDVAYGIAKQTIALKEGASGVGEIMATLSGSMSDVVAAYTSLVAVREKMGDVNLGKGLNLDTLKGAGDLKSLTDALSSYYDKYFDATEKVKIETMNMTEQFGAVGYALPKSREELRHWIEAAATTGDQLKVGKLLSLASAFDTLEASIEDLGKNDALFGEAAVDKAKQAYDDAVSAAEAAYSKLEESINVEKAKVQKTVDSMNDMLSSVGDAIKATMPTMSETQSFEKAMGIINDAISLVNGGGDISSLTGFDDALKTISEHSDDSYSTLLDYQRSQAAANAALNELKTSGERQLSEAQKQIDLLDSQLQTARSQLDALQGINSGVLSLSAAMSGFASAMSAAYSAKATYTATQAGAGAPAGGGVSTAIESLYKTVLGRTSDEAGKAFWMNAVMNQGVSLSHVADEFYKSPEFNQTGGKPSTAYTSAIGSIPSFDVGTNDVPYDMVANIHKGERIIPAADNYELKQTLKDAANGGGNDSSALEAKINDLILVIQQGDVANVQKTAEMFKIIRDWNQTGMPAVRSDS